MEGTRKHYLAMRAERDQLEIDVAMWKTAHDFMNMKAAKSMVECDQLRAEVAYWKASRNGVALASLSVVCNQLRVELAEARKDTARMDWLENELTENRYDMDIALQSDEEDGVWFAKFYRRETGAVHGIAYDPTDSKTQTVRAAIDAAAIGLKTQ